MSAQDTLDVEWVDIDQLFGSPANPRHNDAAVPHVAASIQPFGWRQPLVVKRSGEVIAGNTRLEAAQETGAQQVPVMWFDGDDLDATAYAIADNRTAEFANWNDPALSKLLEHLRSEDALEGVGYSDDEIDALLAELHEDEDTDLDDPGPEERPVDPVTQPGDQWLLGEHRLLCGDSRNRATLERLMGNERAALVWTDPPYGVSYVSADGEPVFNDEPDKLRPLLEASLGHAATFTSPSREAPA